MQSYRMWLEDVSSETATKSSVLSSIKASFNLLLTTRFQGGLYGGGQGIFQGQIQEEQQFMSLRCDLRSI